MFALRRKISLAGYCLKNRPFFHAVEVVESETNWTL
jgi:hypothetical protein